MAKRVAFLARYVGTVNRGAETYVLELSKRLANDFEVEILKDSDSDSLLKIIKGKYDLVIPTNGRMQALKASLGRIFGYKTLISGQSGIGRDDIWNIALTCPDIFVALTEKEQEWAKKWAWKTKLKKIPNGVDLEKFNPKGERLDLGLPKPIVLSVGALEWYKHHELTIQAMSKTGTGSLLILGTGSQKEKLEKMGKDLLGEKRFKIMKADFLQMPNFYRSADIFVLPSWDREAFGIVYVEALASNLPVVAPDDSPRREIIGEAGILTDVFNSEKYSAALEEVVNRKWGNIPRERAEKFSWEKVAEQYKKVIEEII